MRRSILLISSVLLLSSMAFAEGLTFKCNEHDFEKIDYKGRKTATFYYSNQSDTPLVIVDAKTTCGCTKVEYPKKPIKPGESDSLTVTFLAKSEGAFFKSINIVTQKSTEKLTIKGVVVK